MSGSVRLSTTFISIIELRHFGIEVGAGDEDVDAGDVLLCVAAGGISSPAPAAASELPRRRCSGLSTPLASAISRQRVASP